MKITGQENIAEIFGVAPKTVIAWQEEGLPVLKRGQPGVPSEYDSAACIRWFADRELNRANADRPRDRLHRAQAENAELNLRIRRGELAPVEEVSRILRSAVLAAREYLRGQPPRLALELEGLNSAERQALLAKNFDIFLKILSAWRPDS